VCVCNNMCPAAEVQHKEAVEKQLKSINRLTPWRCVAHLGIPTPY